MHGCTSQPQAKLHAALCSGCSLLCSNRSVPLPLARPGHGHGLHYPSFYMIRINRAAVGECDTSSVRQRIAGSYLCKKLHVGQVAHTGAAKCPGPHLHANFWAWGQFVNEVSLCMGSICAWVRIPMGTPPRKENGGTIALMDTWPPPA